MKSNVRPAAAGILLALTLTSLVAHAALVTSTSAGPWQGADVGTFAALYYGSDTPANRALVISNQLLDDGTFDTSTGTAATLMHTTWSDGGVSTGFSYGYGVG